MVNGSIEQVRRFNRTVAQRIGALDTSFLARDRPLGEARMLWEIGADGCEVRALRNRLELDPAHASRLLRSLEADGWPRSSRVPPTGASGSRGSRRRDSPSGPCSTGAATRSPNRCSPRSTRTGASASSQRCAPSSACSPRAAVEIRPVDPTRPDARQCLRAYFAEIDDRSGWRFDPATGSPPSRTSSPRPRVPC